MFFDTKKLFHTSEVSQNRKCLLCKPGVVPYQIAWQWQRSLQQRVYDSDSEDVLILLEHPPVYTLGQGADPKFIKFDPDKSRYDVYRVERGGEVTYHCPGQLVGYPILNLQYYYKDLHWYLRQLEEVVIQVLAVYGLPGERYPGLTGVWLEGYKVAAIGIKVSRWVTMHGFALNVCPDMTGFERIVPCGISDKPVGSLSQWIPDITLEQVIPHVTQAFATVFDVNMVKTEVKHLQILATSH
ncbi:lipoyl(octanoyl) transferase LipB [Gloeocapsopsis sp. IPPAS B-1203]|uniref:lipoyl(octanoyl) transferase LipB n=1 Tax=Gloeocapsopsis sp. IPPAS B-1203 TaxID=2049454 RepID=UPI000C1A1D81|nr:lipoyl(octanoyl) transferase LipB [Gloeocapsopsis sp. IPPAS B-1203]PIG92952.1 lipoyl(octanoyl) transferase [Gloeocapsopsis sp. IPPAS B-1203]